MKQRMKWLFVIAVALLTVSAIVFAGTVGDINGDDEVGLEEAINALQVVSGIRPGGWKCQDDDVTNGIYRICNYFPLDAGNQWIYSTGDRTIVNEAYISSSGHRGIRYGTIAYEYDMFIENSMDGLLVIARYSSPEKDFLEFNTPIPLIGAEMHVGENINHTITWPDNSTTIFNTMLMGTETITVPSGEHLTLKFKISINDVGECTYDTYVWVAKHIGIVKIQRTNANPSNCDGCIFICGDMVNTIAELVSAVVDGNNY